VETPSSLPSLRALDPESTHALLRAIFENAQDAIGISHSNIIRVVNPSLVALFGYQREDQLVGRSFLELLAPSGRETIRGFVRLREEGQPVPGLYRTRALRADGAEFDVEIRTTTYAHSGEFYALALLREIGAELAAERASRESQELYRSIFEANTAVKLLIDPADGRIVDANPAAVEFYGWSRETLRTMRISDINTLTAEEVQAELERARSGRRRYFRFRHRVASGAIRHVEVHSGTMEVEGRTLLLSILQDVTDRYALEEQLRQSQELEAIGRVAGGVAHDFNNLLTIIGTACEQLAQGLGPEEAAREPLRDIDHAARRARELTRQLLAFGGRQVLEMRPVQLNEVITGLQSLLSRALGPRVELRLLLEPGLPAVAADAGQLEQVLMNLAINARDAMDGAGTLEIATAAAGMEVALVVRDTGRGMDDATKARIFEPFFTTKPRGQGTGLGLPTAYGIITQSGGSIGVESEPGQGAAFTVRLPLFGGVPSPTASTPPRLTVLLVEDEAEIRRALRERLKDAGYRVVSASSAEEASTLPSEELARVDALVTDVEMPGRSGLELVREMLEQNPTLAVLVISGRPLSANQIPDGAGFLQKPFSRQALLRELRQRMAHRRG
jgi:PAS domain S-box-containing protein